MAIHIFLYGKRSDRTIKILYVQEVWIHLYNDLLYEMGQDFWEIQYEKKKGPTSAIFHHKSKNTVLSI